MFKAIIRRHVATVGLGSSFPKFALPSPSGGFRLGTGPTNLAQAPKFLIGSRGVLGVYAGIRRIPTSGVLPRDALVYSAVLRLHVVRPSVRPSVRLSVTLVDQDHIGWKSWKLIARSIRPTPLFFVAQRPST